MADQYIKEASDADVGINYDSSETMNVIEGNEVPLTPENVMVEAITADGQADAQAETPADTPISITQEQDQTTEEVVADSQLAKEDPNRLSYWQSQADLAKNEASKVSQELVMYQNLVQRMVNDQKQGGTPEAPQPTAPLSQPQKPTSFNEVDAYNDPESDSFKYRVAKEEYNDNRFDTLMNMQAQQEEQRQAQVAQQQEQMIVNQAYTHVKNGYGWDEGKASNFVKWAQDPANVTVDVLAKIYEMQNAPNAGQQQANNKATDMRQAGERLQVPRTTTVTAGQAEPQLSDQDLFNAGLLSHSRTRK